eukprot:6471886-Amphidinium_carterae.1
MELLGWTMSEKTPDFSLEFDALCVRVNLEEVGIGRIIVIQFVKNKASRVDRCLNKDVLSRRELEALRGRLQFAQVQHFNRLGNLTVNAIGEALAVAIGGVRMTESLRLALSWMGEALQLHGWFGLALRSHPSCCIPMALVRVPTLN